MVLGELTANLLGSVRAGEPCVVMGWALGGAGRKRRAGSALLGEDGRVRALGQATWIAIAPRDEGGGPHRPVA
jgi:hypothetical protein